MRDEDTVTRCPTCKSDYLTHGHHPACPETAANRRLDTGPPCVCELYGPVSCGCVPQDRTPVSVHPSLATDILAAIAALEPGERDREWRQDGTPRTYGRRL